MTRLGVGVILLGSLLIVPLSVGVVMLLVLRQATVVGAGLTVTGVVLMSVAYWTLTWWTDHRGVASWNDPTSESD